MTTTEISHDGSETRTYLTIGAILAVITIVEVIVAYPNVLYSPEHPDPTMVAILVPILMLLSVAKGTLVVMYFMHLKGDASIFKFLFIVPFMIASLMIIVFLALFSGHVGIAG